MKKKLITHKQNTCTTKKKKAFALLFGSIVLLIGTIAITATTSCRSAKPTNIVIFGSNKLKGISGVVGSSQYTAKDNLGNLLINCVWSIAEPASNTKATGISIDANGLLTWITTATSGSFTIECKKSNHKLGIMLVTLTINPPDYLISNGDTYTIDTSNDFMTNRNTDYSSQPFNFIDLDGNKRTVNKNTITEMHLTNLPPIITAPKNYGRSLCEYMKNLTVVDIQLPQSIMTVMDGFCQSMFAGCDKLTSLPSYFQLPLNISGSIGNDFCANMFDGCSSLASLPTNFNLPQGIATVGDSFCAGLFMWSTKFSSLPQKFQIPQGITNIGNRFCNLMFFSTALTADKPNDTLNFPKISGHDSDYAFNCFFNTQISPSTPKPGDQIPVHRN